MIEDITNTVQVLKEAFDAEVEVLICDAAEAMAINFVIATEGDFDQLTKLYLRACEELRDQIALKLAGHTNEEFH
jgi:hypothetical protein